jgi:hypothetical protein
MFSKLFFKLFSKTLKSLSLILLTANLIACNQVFNKSPEQSAPQSPNLGFRAQCLADVLPVMEKFMNSTATQSEVSDSWDCFASGMTLFETKVRSNNRNPGNFTPRQIADFFETYFFKSLKIDDGLLVEIMHFKQLFVGGSSAIVTHQELLKLIDFAHQMKQISLQLLPYMQVYTKSWQPGAAEAQQNIAYFQKANDSIQSATAQIATMIVKNNQSYSITNVSTLFHELQGLYGTQWEWLHSLDNSLPLIEKLKNSLVGGNENSIAGQEWDQLGSLSARGYIQFLRYYYFIRGTKGSGLQLAYFTDTATDIFSFLHDVVKGKPGGVFTKAELTEILTRLNDIFPKANFSAKFVDHFMKFKVPVLGGSGDNFLPEDFARAENKVSMLKSVLENVIAYQDIYTLEWDKARLSDWAANKFFSDARTGLQSSATTLAAFMEAGYDLQDFADLLDDVSDVLESPTTKIPWLEKARSYLPVLISYKKIVFANKNSEVEKSEWNHLFTLSSSFFSSALDFKYFVASVDFGQGQGLNNLDALVVELQKNIGGLLSYRSNNTGDSQIRIEEFADLAFSIKSTGLLPSAITLESFETLIKAVVQKLLADPRARLAGEKSEGFSKANLSYAVSEYKIWSANQHALSAIFATSGSRVSGRDLVADLQREKETSGLVELENLLGPYPPLTVNSRGLIYLGYHVKDYDFESVSSLNLSRAAARLLIRGYVGSRKRLDNITAGITQKEFDSVVSAVKPLASELGLIGPNDTTFSASRFLEGNLFMPGSNGDEYLSLVEATELLSFLRSGLTLNTEIMNDLGQGCLQSKDATNANNDELSMGCVFDFYQNNTSKIFASMPDMARYLENLNGRDFEKMSEAFLRSAGWVPSHKSTIRRSEIAMLPHVFQYAEALIQRFDTNHDGMLDDAEANVAYPLYRLTLATFDGIKIDLVNRSAFLYMLMYGKIPCGFGDLAGILFGNKNDLVISVDRMRISDLFGDIADSVKNKGKSPECSGRSPKDADLNPPTDFKFEEGTKRP